jgi:peptide/nickel transport system substrate-binding protein
MAVSRPAPVARGRLFQLPSNNVWADSQPDQQHLCTAEDVVWTVNLLKKARPQAFPTAWSRLVRTVDTSQTAENPFAFEIILDRDHWQPLSLMDFMVLPRSSFPQGGEPNELAKFDRQPVGTGPYTLLKTEAKQVRFTANPYYRKTGQPYIREVRFHQLDPIEARDAFRANQVHVVYDLRPTHVDELSRQGSRIIKLDARSVNFLAPNYDVPALNNRHLRLAIAHAIDREAILTNTFRPSQAPRDHAALTGLFLDGTWPFNARAPQFSAAEAPIHLMEARKELGGAIPTLRLAYPDRDPSVGEACSEIKRQLGALGLTIDLLPVDPHRFYDTIIRVRDFDLAYWRHDFDDETYWIWPLFDPADRGPGGANFMHIAPDITLSNLFHEMVIHKQFTRIQSAARKIHDQIARDAPAIPLWQLNPYVAIHSKLDISGSQLDPVHLFKNVEQWRLNPLPK